MDGITHTYLLDGTKILRETWGENTLIPIYDNEDSVCGIIYNGVPYYFQKNLQGDVIGITNEHGTVVGAYRYDAWGANTGIITCTELTDGVDIANINPFRYRSYYFDKEIEMYYLQSRYYNPQIGRWLNSDEAAFCCASMRSMATNTFSYCENNMLLSIDPLGFFSIPRAVISFGIDAVIWTVFSAGALSYACLTQPVKAVARFAGKAFIKSKMLGILRGFMGTLAKAIYAIAKFLVPIIKTAVGWLFRKWASKLTATTLAGMIAGGLGSILANTFLSAIASNITVFLSVGGLIAGLWDWFSDDSLNGWIKLW